MDKNLHEEWDFIPSRKVSVFIIPCSSAAFYVMALKIEEFDLSLTLQIQKLKKVTDSF